MIAAADSFGTFDQRGSLALGAARAVDRVVTWGIVIILAMLCALAGYALWDSWNVLEGGNQLTKPSDAESFAALRAINPDVCAWLTIDNTNIDYPVVQGKDNFEYLTKDAKGEYSASGSIFLDAADDPSFPGPYEVVMGHHMQYGKMFGDLDKFHDEGFFQANSTGELMLPDHTLSLEIVAVMQVDAYDSTIFGTPKSADKMGDLVSYVQQHALFKRDGAFSSSDHLIMLSTCNSEGADARTVLVCRVSGDTAN